MNVMTYSKSKKGFTLMELLVTVILVAILASYAVYYYNNTMKEGEVNAAEGKLASLGGAVARYMIEYGNIVLDRPVKITTSIVNGICNYHSNNAEIKMKSIFSCGYIEKSLGFNNNFDFYFGSPNDSSCGGAINTTTVFMKPKTADSLYPSCAYFNPSTDKVVEVQ